MKTFLHELLLIDSPSGYCHNATKYISDKFLELGYTTTHNAKGNLELFIDNGADYTVGLSAHTDTLGFVVSAINADGTLSISNVGGPILSTVNGEYCKIYTRDGQCHFGTILNKNRAAHVHTKAKDKIELTDLIVRLDNVVMSKEQVKELGISNGDFVCYDPKTVFINDFVKSRFLDDKAGVAIIYDLLKEIKEIKLNVNIHIIISTYEEVGHGSSYLPLGINELIAIDMGCVGENLEGNETSVSICSKDSSGPYDYAMTSKLIKLAKDNNISYAVDVYPMYGSDASAALRGGNNIKAALIGPGVDASHGMERTHMQAIIQTTQLLKLYLTSGDK